MYAFLIYGFSIVMFNLVCTIIYAYYWHKAYHFLESIGENPDCPEMRPWAYLSSKRSNFSPIAYMLKKNKRLGVILCVIVCVQGVGCFVLVIMFIPFMYYLGGIIM